MEEEIPLGSSKKEKKEKKPSKKKTALSVSNGNEGHHATTMITEPTNEDPMQVMVSEHKRGDEDNKVFICRNFHTKFPLKPGALIIAPSKEQAVRVLTDALNSSGNPSLKPTGEMELVFQEVDMRFPKAYIISDGDFKEK